MLPDSLFRKEVLEDLRGKKALAFRFLLPLVFVAPLAMDVPVGMKAGLVPLAALFLGVFGSSIGMVKLREGGMLQRLSVLPTSPRALVLGYLMANAAMDALQLALLTAIVISLGAGGAAIVLICLGAAIVAANALGLIVAVLAGSSGEVHLFAAIAVLGAGGASGLFMPSVPPVLGAVLPFTPLASSIQASWGGGDPGLWYLAPISALILLLMTVMLSARLLAWE